MVAPLRKSSFTTLLFAIIVVMGLEIVYLIYQNRTLRAKLRDASSLQVLQQGQAVPPMTATDLNGAAVEIRYGPDEPPTVLIWFSPSCHVCSENGTFWNDLFDRSTAARLRFLALCDADVNEARAYVAEHSLKFPVISGTDDRLTEAYNGRVMPQTALISSQGKIEQVWPGALDKTRQDEVIAALDSLTK